MFQIRPQDQDEARELQQAEDFVADEDVLAGSGATDWMLSALRVVRGELRAHPASYFFGAAVIDIGQPTQVLFPAEDAALAAILGGAWRFAERLGIKGQIDANSALYDSQLEELGQTAVQLTLGGWLQFGQTGVFEFGIGEDLHVSTSPDVSIYLNLNWQLP